MSESASAFSPLMMLVGASILLSARLIYSEQRLGGGDLVHLVMRVMGYCLIAMGWLALCELLLGTVFGVLFWIVTMIVLGSMVGRYRQAERSALLWVLAIAAQRQIPLTPAIEALTSMYCPAASAVIAMTSSVRFPNVALSRPPTASPVFAATDSVAWLSSAASGTIASTDNTKSSTCASCFTFTATKSTGTNTSNPNKGLWWSSLRITVPMAIWRMLSGAGTM